MPALCNVHALVFWAQNDELLGRSADRAVLAALPVQAAKLGLVDGVVPREQLLPAARAWAADIACGAKPRNFTLYRCGCGGAVADLPCICPCDPMPVYLKHNGSFTDCMHMLHARN